MFTTEISWKYVGYLSNSEHVCPSTKFYAEESHFVIFELLTIRFKFRFEWFKIFETDLVEEFCTLLWIFIMTGNFYTSVSTLFIGEILPIYIYTGSLVFGFFSGCTF